MKYIAFIVMMFAPLAFAGGPLVDNSHEQSQGQAQGQSQGQAQGQLQGQNQSSSNRSSNNNKNTAVGVGYSKSGAVSGSNSSSNSESGSSSDNSVSISHDATKATSASAAALYSSGCQIGASGQGKAGGVSLIVDDPVCQNLKLADAYMKQIDSCTSNECVLYAVEMRDHHLNVASDHADKSADSSHFAKTGVETGLGALGVGTAVAVGCAAGPVGCVAGGLTAIYMMAN